MKRLNMLFIGMVIMSFVIGGVNGQMAEKNTGQDGVNLEDEATYKYFAGLKLKEVITDDTYMLMDG